MAKRPIPVSHPDELTDKIINDIGQWYLDAYPKPDNFLKNLFFFHTHHNIAKEFQFYNKLQTFQDRRGISHEVEPSHKSKSSPIFHQFPYPRSINSPVYFKESISYKSHEMVSNKEKWIFLATKLGSLTSNGEFYKTILSFLESAFKTSVAAPCSGLHGRFFDEDDDDPIYIARKWLEIINLVYRHQDEEFINYIRK